ncbi:MAG: hypothetical protein MZU97_06110 [Bacillus subtilis]|nr:hypothetical protein [Bacillus subtilis]
MECVAIRLGIDPYLLADNTDLSGIHQRATALEAILGAIYLSKGIVAVKAFAEKIQLIQKKSPSILDIIDKQYLRRTIEFQSNLSLSKPCFVCR